MSRFEAGLDGVTFRSRGSRLLGGFYRAAGDTRRPTAVLLHGLPGIEKNLDIAYRLRDVGWNCLYFHFRGSWGSEGVFSLAGLEDDTRAALQWVRAQPSVDETRLVLIGGSTGGYVALRYAATDPGVRAVVGVCSLVDPRAFDFPDAMAEEFAGMLHGITGPELQRQWQALPSLTDSLAALSSRSILLVTGDQDELFPPAHYQTFVELVPEARWTRGVDADHAFSRCRTWMVQTVTRWLLEEVGADADIRR